MPLKTNKSVALKYHCRCNMSFPSNMFLDLLLFLLLFAAFYLFVAIIKTAFFQIKTRYFNSFTKKRSHLRRKKPKKPAAIRSIEIDPEEVDRIYVRKIS